MSLLNPPEMAPARALGLLRLVAALDTKELGVPVETVGALFWPPSTRTETTVNHPSLLVRELRSLGLLEGEEAGVRLSGEVRARLGDRLGRLEDAVRDAFPHLVWDALRQIPPERAQEEGGGNSTFLVVLAWWLTLDPARAPHQEVALSEAVGRAPFLSSLAPRLNVNDVRMRQFGLWAAYLGAAWKDAVRTFADPTELVRGYLDEVLQPGQSVDVGTFYGALGRAIPVLADGAYARAVGDHLPRDPRHLRPALSLALVRLEGEGRLRMDHQSDADTWELDWARSQGTRITHIVRPA